MTTSALPFIPAEFIRKKRFGGELTSAELDQLVRAYTSGSLPDYQMAAFIMAVCFRGMTPIETAHFTRALQNSGRTLQFQDLHPHVVDKHSTGGVGDKTSLILAPLAAAAGLHVPMIAGRGLGHTGGTLDKLESISGFSVQLDLDSFAQLVRKEGFAIIGQTLDICPADKKLYALRDVTGTIDSLPLICGSIMSKKLAEGLSGLVLDVKFGSGAFMKTAEDAKALALALQEIGQKNGVRVHVLLTSMEQPLGRFIGNALEVQECLDIMNGRAHVVDGIDLYAPTRELTLRLAAEMIWVGQKANSFDEGYALAKQILESGRALELFHRMVIFQGGSVPFQLPQASAVVDVTSESTGFVQAMNVEALGMASLMLGAGRVVASDTIDPAVGIEMVAQLGRPIKKGQPLCRLHINAKTQIDFIKNKIREAIVVGDLPPHQTQLVAQVIR